MKILVISPLASPPATNGAKRRIANLLEYLQNCGHEVHFVYTQHESIDAVRVEDLMGQAWTSVHIVPPAQAPIRSLGEDFGVDDWTEHAVGERIGEIARRIRPDIALVNYVFQSRYFDYLSRGVLKVLDTHDKLSRADVYRSAGLAPGFFHTTEAEELRGLARADVILAIQDGEAEYFRRSGKPVVIAGDVCSTRFVDRRYEDLHKIGFLSAYNKFNLYSLEKFLPAFLRVAERLHDPVHLHLAGNLARGARRNLPSHWFHNPYVTDEGFVDDIEDFYRRMDLVVNPTLVGTGLKIKTIEGLSYGAPMISTRIGFDGLPIVHPWHEAENEDALVQMIEEIATARAAELTKLSNISRSLFTEYQINLRHNIDTVFSLQLVGSKQAGADLDASLQASRVGPLADRNAITYRTVYDVRRPSYGFSIAHVINPVALPEGSDLYLAQPITFESMRRASAFASDEVEVELHAVGFAEDAQVSPRGFECHQGLNRSVLDVGTFSMPRKLPLLTDLLTHLDRHSHADYFVYTNADIGVLPHFYAYVADKIASGYDAFVINRRTVSKRYAQPGHLDAVYADYGSKHPGYDCFVFHRRHLESMYLGNVCIGVHLIGRVLLWNLMASARKFEIFAEDHATFHVGDDNISKDIRQLDFIRHNTAEALAALEHLEHDHALLTKLRKTQATHLISLDFGRAILRKGVDPASGATIYHDIANRPIFIHALFRTGSTYLWQKIRQSARAVTYYEPLHEELAYFSHDDLEVHKNRHRPGRFHTTNSDDWFFREFEDLIPESRRGVIGYDRRFAYDQFANNDDNPELLAYIDGLLANAMPKLPVLQFNRTAMRQEWFKRNYPKAMHVYLFRDHVSQWASYTRFYKPERRGFARNDAVIAGKNRTAPLLRPLERLVPLVQYDDPYDFFNFYDLVFDQYDWEQRYTIFYYIWLIGLIEGCRHSDLIIDMNRLSSDPVYRLRVGFEFLCSDIPLQLEDASITEREPDPQLITPFTMRRVEQRVQAVVAGAFGPESTTVLRSRGYGRLADAMLEAEREANQILADAPSTADIAALRERMAGNANNASSAADPANATRDDSASAYPTIGGSAGFTPWPIGPITLVGGWSWDEGGHRWMESTDAGLRLLMPESATIPILQLSLKTHEALTARNPTVSIQCNDQQIYDGLISTENQIFQIMLRDLAKPGEEINVRIRSNSVGPPDAHDDRHLSVCLSDARLDDALDPNRTNEIQPCDQSVIEIGRRADQDLAGDWSWPEEGFRWLDGLSGAFRIAPSVFQKARRIRIRAHVHPTLAENNVPVELWVDDRRVLAKSMTTKPSWYEARFPDDLRTSAQPLTVTLVTSTASHPSGAEARRLSAALWIVELR